MGPYARENRMSKHAAALPQCKVAVLTPCCFRCVVFDMSAEEKQVQLAMLGAISAAMIAAGYPGETITQSSSPFGTRCMG